MSDNATVLEEILHRFEKNQARHCLQDIISHYKMSLSVYVIYQISESLPAHKKSLELVDLLNFMILMGYDYTRVPKLAGRIDERLLPCLLFDPEKNSLQLITEKSEQSMTGTAYFFQKGSVKTTQDKREELHFVQRGWFMDMLFRFHLIFIAIFKISSILSLTNLFTPLFIMLMYNQMADSSDLLHLYALGLGGLLMVWIERMMRRKRAQYLVWFIARLDAITNTSIFSKLIRLPAYAIENASIESQISRLKSFESVRDFFTSHLFIHLLDLPFIITSILLLTWIGGNLVIVPIVVTLIYLVMLAVFKPQLKTMMFHSSKARSALQMSHMETFEKQKSIILNGMKSVWIEKIRDLSAQSSLSHLNAVFHQVIFETSAHGVSLFANLAAIYWGVYKIWGGSLNGGSLFACILLTNRILGPLQAICSSAQKIEQLFRSVQQIDSLMALDTERELAPSLAKAYKLKGNIEVSKVGLRYTKESDPVLIGFSLNIPAGKFIAISGENGAGKSTLLKLLLGLYRPQIGAIYLDGRDIRQIDPLEIRKKFVYLPQSPHFFHGSILENLQIANLMATHHELMAALEFAGIAEEIQRLPKGLKTEISKETLNLSSDLPYCLSIARGYLKNSPVWLIDELPHFFLNSPKGMEFLNKLHTWKNQKTILFVSNEELVIKQADQSVMFFSGGKSQIGDPETMLKQMKKTI